MGTKKTAEFRADAVRLALNGGRSRRQLAKDLGVGFSTLNKWVAEYQQADLMAGPHDDLAKKNARLRAEQMRFAFVKGYDGPLSLERLCRILQITSRGFRAWLRRPRRRHAEQDEVLLVHLKAEHATSHGSYGRPRMTAELKELGHEVGERRVGRLMAEHGLNAVRTRKYKRTTDSLHGFAVAPNLLAQDFAATACNQKWAGDISYIWTNEGWVYLAVIIDLYSRRVIGGAVSDRLKRDLALAGTGHGYRSPKTASGRHPSHRSRQPVLLKRISDAPQKVRLQGLYVWQGKLLR